MSRRIVAAMTVAVWIVGTAATIAHAGTATPAGADACATYQPQVPDPSQWSTVIDNRYFPLPVGRTLVYRGVRDGLKQTDRVTVTDQTKVIQGISATVVHDVATHHGTLLEKTTDWYAQDDQGNVWYLGEDTKAYEPNGKVDTSGSWETGVNGAKPGLIMEADPQVPDSYRQECLAGEALDTAWVVSIGGSKKVPYGVVHHVLRSLEFTPLEPDVVDQKLYAPGLGIVFEQSMAGGHEVAELVKVTG